MGIVFNHKVSDLDVFLQEVCGKGQLVGSIIATLLGSEKS